MNDSTKKAAAELLVDPLSSVTRATKKTLFLFSSISVLIAYTGVVPTNIAVLQLPGLTENVVRFSLTIATLYNLVTFLVYIWSDYCRLRLKWDVFNLAWACEVEEATLTPPDDEADFHRDEFKGITGYRELQVSHSTTQILTRSRIMVDILLPIACSVMAVVYLGSKYFME